MTLGEGRRDIEKLILHHHGRNGGYVPLYLMFSRAELLGGAVGQTDGGRRVTGQFNTPFEVL